MEELAVLDLDVRMDNLRAEEYKCEIADIMRGLDVKSVIESTELCPKPRKKPFKIRFRDFIYRIKNTL